MSEATQPTAYQLVPVDAARQIAEACAKSIIVIASYDPVHGLLHVTTYGVSPQDKEWAAQAGELVAETLAVGARDLWQTFEDYRHLDAGKATARIERLSRACVAADHAIASVMAVREGITDEALQTCRDFIKAALEPDPPTPATASEEPRASV